jgi:hypothetical protein
MSSEEEEADVFLFPGGDTFVVAARFRGIGGSW